MSKNSKEPLIFGEVIGIKTNDSQELIGFLKEGLSVSTFTKLQTALEVSTKRLADTVNISLRTINRRKKEGKFRTDESERVLRIARLYDMAKELHGDEKLARTWLKTPKRALNDQTPLEFAETEPGAQEVADLLGRLKHGVFS